MERTSIGFPAFAQELAKPDLSDLRTGLVTRERLDLVFLVVEIEVEVFLNVEVVVLFSLRLRGSSLLPFLDHLFDDLFQHGKFADTQEQLGQRAAALAIGDAIHGQDSADSGAGMAA